MVQNLSDAVALSLIDLWNRFVSYLPTLLSAIIVLVFGWLVAITAEKIVTSILEVLHLDTAVEKLGVKKDLAKAGVKMHASNFIGALVKWFLLIVTLMAATDILGFTQVTNFLNDVLKYIPNIVVAAIILMVVTLLANFVYKTIKGSLKATGLLSTNVIAVFAKWAIIIFGIMAALVQLKVAEEMIKTTFTGIIAMLALAGGLAFGLGGRDAAEDLVEKIKKELSNGK